MQESRDGKTWNPKNYSGKYHGQTTLTNALAHSLNAATVRIMQKTGYKEVHDVARKAGFTSKLPPDLSLALGSADVSLLEMTAAYTPFAGDGSFTRPSFISKIVLADGRVMVSRESVEQGSTKLAEWAPETPVVSPTPREQSGAWAWQT